MANTYDCFLKREVYIPTQILRVTHEGEQKRVELDKGTLDYIHDINPIATALMVYFAVRIHDNNTVEYTIHELMGATGKNRVTLKTALRVLLDSEFIVSLRHQPSPNLLQ